MKQLHAEIAQKQRAANVRVIKPPHALGFLDPDLPTRETAPVHVESPKAQSLQ
jgi:hypothetical protein